MTEKQKRKLMMEARKKVSALSKQQDKIYAVLLDTLAEGGIFGEPTQGMLFDYVFNGGDVDKILKYVK